MGAVQRQRLEQLFKAPQDRPGYQKRYGSQIQAWHLKHRGQTVFVLGNGPTLNDAPLDKLRELQNAGLVYTMGVNKSHLAYHSNYLTFIDRPYTQKEYFRHLVEPYSPDRLFTTTLHTEFIPSVPVMISSMGETGFCWDLYNEGAMVKTAGWTALQVVAWMGFSEIYLLGCDGVTDYGNGKNGWHHFYPRASHRVREAVCMFPPSYVDFWNAAGPPVIEEAARRGVTIRTCAERRAIWKERQFFVDARQILSRIQNSVESGGQT